MTIFSRAKTYEFLKVSTFTGVDRIPPPVGTRHGLWSYSWDGIHPKTPYLTHRLSISGSFEKHFTNATHELKIQKQHHGADRRLLYVSQLDLSQHPNIETVAEQILCAMVLFLLKLRHPQQVPGVIEIPHESQRSGWAIALKETLQGIESAS